MSVVIVCLKMLLLGIPDTVSIRLPVRSILFALRAEMLYALRRLQVCAVRAGLVNHLLQKLRVLKHRAGTKVVLVERLSLMVSHEQRALQDLEDGTVMNAILYHFPQTAQLARAGIVHRLDKDTSGLMVIALSKYAQIKLVRAISKHDVVREYEAICEGLITAGGTIDKDISRDPHNRTRMATVCDGMGREAVTHYRVMEQFREHTLLRLRLETGRTHQIRVHMASIDHPLLGDGTYGIKRLRLMKGASEELSEALRNYRHQALHAAHIEFIHPISGEPLSFDAPIPDDFNRLIELLREDERVNGEKL